MADHVGAAVGQQFGDYRLMRFLGQGSFGEVYLAEHVSDQTLVAVKVLQVRLTDTRDLKSFINEARTFRLIHPNIVRLLDFGIGENDLPFLVMDYAPNGTLRQRHPRGTLVPPLTIIRYIKQIAAALQYAHDRRLIHRDVKPDNILLGPNDEILLSDFGIATVAHGTHSLQSQGRAGTTYYMAPEQIQGKPRPASDQYALGVIVYEWLCGDRPFSGSAIEVAMQHVLAPPPSLCEKISEISPEVEQVVMTALAKDPHQRFASVRAFADALEQSLQPKPPVGTTLLMYSGHSDEVWTTAWSPDGIHIASGSADKTVQVWHASTGQTIITYSGHTKSVNAVAWSPDGRRVASVSLDGTVQVWNALTGDRNLIYRGHSHWVRAVTWSPDGMLIASGSWDNTVQIWDATTGNHISTYRGHSSEVRAAAWSPDGTRIVSGSADNTVQIWDAAGAVSASLGGKSIDDSRKAILTYSGHTKNVNAVAWSPDGSRIASASIDGTVQVWNALTGETILTYSGHTKSVNAVAWSPDGSRIASSARDKLVQIWNATTGDNLYTYSDHSGWVTAVAWSSDGRYLTSASLDKTVRIWRAV